MTKASLTVLRLFHQDAVTAEQKSLGQHVESLLSWLTETETQMEKEKKNDGSDQLTQQLTLCKASFLENCIISIYTFVML